MGHPFPVASCVMHLIQCYRCSLETSTSSWTVCLWICRIVLRIWEGFPPGSALTDRDMAFQPSHWAPLLFLLLAGHHRPDPCCRNSLGGMKCEFESKCSHHPFCSDSSPSWGQVKLNQTPERENSCRASPSCQSQRLGGSGISSTVCYSTFKSLSTT